MKYKESIIISIIGAVLFLNACTGTDTPAPSSSLSPTEAVTAAQVIAPSEFTVTTSPEAIATAAPVDFVLETVVEEMDFSPFIKSTKYLHYIDPAVLPENLQGQVYSKSGNVLTAYPKGGIAYDANGKEGLILLVGEEPSFFVPRDFAPADFGEELQKAAELFCDDMYYPTYIPEGYILSVHDLTEQDVIDTFKGETGIGKYNRIEFSKPSDDENGKPTKISLLLRYMDKSTAYDGGQNTQPYQFTNINGCKSFIFYGQYGINIELMIGDVHYAFSSKEVALHDMLSMAYSLTLVEANPED